MWGIHTAPTPTRNWGCLLRLRSCAACRLCNSPINTLQTSILMVGGLKPPSVEEEEAARQAAGQGVIFVLEDAQLEVAQVGKVRDAACKA